MILGGLWGSFANVCIYRLPLDRGVVSGRSYCPKCKKQITWKDNIPIISYFLLNGKCRKCKKPISSQYALVEFLSILFFTIIYFLYGITLTTLLLMILSLSFIIIFFSEYSFSIGDLHPGKALCPRQVFLALWKASLLAPGHMAVRQHLNP